MHERTGASQGVERKKPTHVEAYDPTRRDAHRELTTRQVKESRARIRYPQDGCDTAVVTTLEDCDGRYDAC